jgi:hypothetical protein
LDRFLDLLGIPAWEAGPDDVDRVVGELVARGMAPSTRRGYVQAFKDFHRFLPGSPSTTRTVGVLLILGPLTALAGGVEMPLVNPKPLGTLYSVTALVLVISGAAATAVLVAL